MRWPLSLLVSARCKLMQLFVRAHARNFCQGTRRPLEVRLLRAVQKRKTSWVHAVPVLYRPLYASICLPYACHTAVLCGTKHIHCTFIVLVPGSHPGSAVSRW
jgi:hypothetical protein